MIPFVIGWIGFIVALAVSFVVFRTYLKTRTLSNRMLAAASKDFFEASHRLLSADDELPDDILNIIDKMNETINDRRGHWALLRILRRTNLADTTRVASKREDIDQEMNQLRPELRTLFSKAVVAWLNYLTHRNFFAMIWIGLVMLRTRSKSGELLSEDATGLQMLKSFDTALC